MLQPYFREAGQGPGVVCLHANASTSGQWRELMELLAPRYRVLAPDCYGAGKSPRMPAHGHSLRREIALLEPVFARAGTPHVLVGHSYGAAVALVAAALQPARVRAVAVYEPTLFSLVDAQAAPPNAGDGIRSAAARAAAAAARDEAEPAARIFIDFWMGEGAWAAMPEARKPAVAQSVLDVRAWWEALAGESTPLSAFSAIDVPVLYLVGGRSPASAHAVARVLVPALRKVRVVQLDRLGHMGPVTHPDVVNAAIARFLDDTA